METKLKITYQISIIPESLTTCTNRETNLKLEDLKPSPDLLNNVKIGQGQLRAIIETYIWLTIYGGCSHIRHDLKQSEEYSIYKI